MGLKKGTQGHKGLLKVEGTNMFMCGWDWTAEHEWGIKILKERVEAGMVSFDLHGGIVTVLCGRWGNIDNKKLRDDEDVACWWNDSALLIRSRSVDCNAFLQLWVENKDRKIGFVRSGNPFENAGLALYS